MTCKLRVIFVREDTHLRFAITAPPDEKGRRNCYSSKKADNCYHSFTHYLFSMATAIAADNLLTPGTRVSAVMLLALLHMNLEFPASRNITKNGYIYIICSYTLVQMLYVISINSP